MSAMATDEKSDAPVACRITLNPELTRVVFCVGEESYGFDYRHALSMAEQLADALRIMREEISRRGRAN
jgi:hypothetical protein